MATWNPSDNSTLTLSNGNLTAAGSQAGWQSVRATKSQSTGKYYFRVQANSFTNSGDFIAGLANSSASLSSYIGSDSHGIGSQHDGGAGQRQIYLNGSSVGSSPALGSAGDYVVLAVDLGNNLYWSTVENSGTLNTNWNNGSNSPAAGTGGISITSVANGAAVFPAFSAFDTSAEGTIDTSTTLSDSTLNGFGVWDPPIPLLLGATVTVQQPETPAMPAPALASPQLAPVPPVQPVTRLVILPPQPPWHPGSHLWSGDQTHLPPPRPRIDEILIVRQPEIPALPFPVFQQFAPVQAGHTTWNPGDNSTLSLTNGNLTATGTRAGWQSVRATTSHTSGKWYFRVQANSFTSAGDFIAGLANSSASLSNYIGADANGIGSQWNGGAGSRQIYLNAAVVGTSPALMGMGDYAVIAVDLDSALYWSTIESSGTLNSNWNNGSNSPAAGTGGINISSVDAAVFPAFSAFDTSAEGTIDTSTTLTNSTLTGFSIWDPLFGVSATIADLTLSAGAYSINTAALSAIIPNLSFVTDGSAGPGGTNNALVPVYPRSDLIEEITYPLGLGAYTLAGATATHFRFADGFGASASVTYEVSDGGGNIEVVQGIFDGVNTLTRNTILASTNGGYKPVNWTGRTRPLVRPLILTLVQAGPPAPAPQPPLPTLSLTVTPAMPIIGSTTPLGATVATLQGVWSDGSPFTGSYVFVAPNFDGGGVYAIDGSHLIVNPAGPGVGAAGGTVEDVTIEATQAASLSLIVTPAMPIIASTTPLGATVATLQGVWSDGSPFTGHYIFVAPNYDNGGVYAISGSNLIVNPAGPGVGAAEGTVEDVSLQAIYP